MRRLALSSALLCLITLSACGDSKEDKQVTETRMDDIDSLEGTISDDMINTDESTDEAPLEAPPAGEPKTKVKDEKQADDKAEEPSAPETDDKAEAE